MVQQLCEVQAYLPNEYACVCHASGSTLVTAYNDQPAVFPLALPQQTANNIEQYYMVLEDRLWIMCKVNINTTKAIWLIGLEYCRGISRQETLMKKR